VDLARELEDREAALLALLAAAATYFVARDWRVMLIAAVGTLVVRVGAGLLLHGTRNIPDDPLPGLTDKESAVARLIHRGYGDPAIAVRLGISLRRAEGRVQRIQDKWHVSTRSEIAKHVAEILGEPPVPPPTRFKQRWELIAEVGTGVAVMALGVGVLTLPPGTPVIGDWRDWIGLSLLAAGLVFAVVSIAAYVSEHRHGN
jgi:DNA-binding CsgD family transcriptional regulator